MEKINKVRNILEKEYKWTKHTFSSVRDMALLKDIVNATEKSLTVKVVKDYDDLYFKIYGSDRVNGSVYPSLLIPEVVFSNGKWLNVKL